MNNINTAIANEFGHKVRARVNGICIQNDKILLVGHSGLGLDTTWLPPGGGNEFGASSESNLIREFKEETNLDVEVVKYLFTCEYINQPLHAIELFFEVRATSNKLRVGYDPELKNSKKIIKKVNYMSFDEINFLHERSRHRIFSQCKSILELLNLKGYFLFEE